MSPGEKRRRDAKRIRDAEREAGACTALRQKGANCGNCRNSFSGRRVGLKGLVCDYMSDHEGYVLTDPNEICSTHRFKGANHHER